LEVEEEVVVALLAAAAAVQVAVEVVTALFILPRLKAVLVVLLGLLELLVIQAREVIHLQPEVVAVARVVAVAALFLKAPQGRVVAVGFFRVLAVLVVLITHPLKLVEMVVQADRQGRPHPIQVITVLVAAVVVGVLMVEILYIQIMATKTQPQVVKQLRLMGTLYHGPVVFLQQFMEPYHDYQ
jgi:hypothetical protein